MGLGAKRVINSVASAAQAAKSGPAQQLAQHRGDSVIATVWGETAPGTMQGVQPQTEQTRRGGSRRSDDAPLALGQPHNAAWAQQALALRQQERPVRRQQEATSQAGVHQVKGGVREG